MLTKLKRNLELLSIKYEKYEKDVDIVALKALCTIPETEEIVAYAKELVGKLKMKYTDDKEIKNLIPKNEIILEKLVKKLEEKYATNIDFITLKAMMNLEASKMREKAIEIYLNKINPEDEDIKDYLGKNKAKKKKINKVKNKKINIDIDINMVFVQGGEYKPSFFVEEREVFDIEVCEYQTTQDMWEKIMGTNPSKFKDGKNPVENVSWWDALKFCNKLSEVEGLEPVYNIDDKGNLKINQLGGEAVYPNLADFRKTEGYRLPTELEWEWFARGGEVAIQNGTFDTKYAGSDNIDEVAWYIMNSGGKTHAVGTKKANELGLYDCSGNVWEWCYDTSEEGYISEERPYIYDLSVEDRSLRGGSWFSDASDCEVRNRNSCEDFRCWSDSGFRLVRTAIER